MPILFRESPDSIIHSLDGDRISAPYFITLSRGGDGTWLGCPLLKNLHALDHLKVFHNWCEDNVGERIFVVSKTRMNPRSWSRMNINGDWEYQFTDLVDAMSFKFFVLSQLP